MQGTCCLLAPPQAAKMFIVMQNMHKWTGGLSDEWAFLSKGGPRGSAGLLPGQEPATPPDSDLAHLTGQCAWPRAVAVCQGLEG